MSNIDNTLIRQRVIDKCLRSIKKYTMADIRDACNEELDFYGEPPITALNTIRNDIRKISNVYPDAVIIQEKIGRNIYYSYEDKNYSIFNIPFTDEEVAQLTQTLSILSRFEGMPQFEWIDDFIKKFKSSVNLDRICEPIVGFDENVDLKGRNYFASLFSAIADKQVLSLSYRNFKKDIVQKFTIHPYYLKQFNKRWFLMAYTEEYNKLSVYAFDRIVSYSIIHKEYISNTACDFNEYFDEMIGVSRTADAKPEKIIINVTSALVPYIITKPFHGTQRVIRHAQDGSITIQIEVIVNYELEQLLLSYGEGIEIVSPSSIREKIHGRIVQCLKNYE